MISKFGDCDWSPISLDLIALDFFLWSYVKTKVYANKPQTIEQLKKNICDVAGTNIEMCEKVMQKYD